ncbi:polysaccharide deacetylase family protein [Bacteroidota bacterium]
MLLIFSISQSPRLIYILDLIFKDILGMEYKLTSNKEEYVKSKLPCLTYSDKAFQNEAFIYDTGFLSEKVIKKQAEEFIIPEEWEHTKIYFKNSAGGILPFDIFSSSFYLISRYEEYLNQNKDGHDRFTAENSMAFKYGFLQQPVVDIWAFKLLNRLQEKYSEEKIKTVKRTYHYIPTIDIDNAWAIKNKNLARTLGALIKSAFSKADLMKRIKVLLDMEKDPYDNYNYIRKLHNQHKVKGIYFFLLGNYNKYDKNISFRNNKYKSLIKDISKYSKTGIHPSYASNLKKGMLKKEIIRFEKISGKKPKRSRQHFLRMNIPETYKILIENGIKEDYTMGYSDKAGFRAGTCTPFFFFDLETNKKTDLKVFSFQIMDISLKELQHDDSKEIQRDDFEKALNLISKIIEEVKNVNGTYISLWHNESLSDTDLWKGWRSVYEFLVKKASANF